MCIPRILPAVFSTLATVLLLSAAPATAAQPIHIGGSGTGVAVMKAISGTFQRANPSFELEVLPSLGSSGSIRAVGDGKLELAVSARFLKAEEKAKGLTESELGRTPLVFAVARDSTVNGISLSEAAEIYEGTRASWPGGKPIRLVLRPPGDTDLALLKAVSPRMAKAVDAALARPGMVQADTDQDTADDLERLPGAFGLTTLAQIAAEGRKLKALALNGVAPAQAALKSGSYPLAKPLILVVRNPRDAPVKAVLDFLSSAEGRAELERLSLVLAAGW